MHSKSTKKFSKKETKTRNLEENFDAGFSSKLSLREKQIQQNYRPVIGIHKWFARRPGTAFRSLIISEFIRGPLNTNFWKSQKLTGVIGDPFMGGGTPIYEATRLGFSTVGTDINPMAYWVVRQSLQKCDLSKFTFYANEVINKTSQTISKLYQTQCTSCGSMADVKYFLWVKQTECPACHKNTDLFPGFLLAENVRHPKNVVVCHSCGELNECTHLDNRIENCKKCNSTLKIKGNVSRKHATCNHCSHEFDMPSFVQKPYQHRLWAIEYHCSSCYLEHAGRQFKKPDKNDLETISIASSKLKKSPHKTLIPDDKVPAGDETSRLHRWGYSSFRELFNDRQLLGLTELLSNILKISDKPAREALLTVFSDFLRYQNMLCRYDAYALKCQDIFSVHGFPVGLVQCENNLLGIEKVGSGAYRHFVQKFLKAKEYCEAPFEILVNGNKKTQIHMDGETIAADLVSKFPAEGKKQSWISCQSASEIKLPKNSLDGVFTDPPYFNNVQYAELMDFCFHWLKKGLAPEYTEFKSDVTRSDKELTGNATAGRDIEHFANGMSKVFSNFAAALKPNAPFVFTYHHNEPLAYSPLVIAILDAELDCTATLPAAAEMSASLHIAGTGSSVMDTVFVCRNIKLSSQMEFLNFSLQDAVEDLEKDIHNLEQAGVPVTEGDKRCLLAGHIARYAINHLRNTWDKNLSIAQKIKIADDAIKRIGVVGKSRISSKLKRKDISDATI